MNRKTKTQKTERHIQTENERHEHMFVCAICIQHNNKTHIEKQKTKRTTTGTNEKQITRNNTKRKKKTNKKQQNKKRKQKENKENQPRKQETIF